jgi:hypothetical protein
MTALLLASFVVPAFVFLGFTVRDFFDRCFHEGFQVHVFVDD